MKDKILEVSISGLQKDGLRFSVDTIAKGLKISKKTVYKYFQSKEDLAIAVYEKFYDGVGGEFDSSADGGKPRAFVDLLDLYYRSYQMIREEVFNKFALNGAIRKLALTKHAAVREKFQNAISFDDAQTAMFIIDSVLEKLGGAPLSLQMSEMLGRLV